MTIYFSKYIFFLWYFFCRNVEIKSINKNSYHIKTKIKELELFHNKKIKIQFLIIKYSPVILFIFLIVSIEELRSLDLIILLAPLYMILNLLFISYKRILIPLSILSAIIIFIIYDILVFPIFIKYLIISYIFIELILDIFQRKQFFVYENNQKEKPVAFAIIKKRSVN